MALKYSVTLEKIIQRFDLQVMHSPTETKKVIIKNNNINRPGLQFSGFYDFFDADRIQVIGQGEMTFIAKKGEEKEADIFETFFSHKPVVVIVTREQELPPGVLSCAQKYGVPLLRTDETTPEFTAALIAFLNVELAPRIVRHGVFIEVYGEGVLILGSSGVGKSETAVELIKRGHRLIADDAVELRRVSRTTIVGSSPSNIRYFLELRGIGIINAKNLFGISAVKLTEQVDLVIRLEHWDKERDYDRLGLDQNVINILGVDRPFMLIPVNPGRNLAVIVEVAAMNNRQRKMGYNSAEELMNGLREDSLKGEEDGEELDVFNEAPLPESNNKDEVQFL